MSASSDASSSGSEPEDESLGQESDDSSEPEDESFLDDIEQARRKDGVAHIRLVWPKEQSRITGTSDL